MQTLVAAQAVICMCCPLEHSVMCCLGLQQNRCRR